MSSKQPLRPRWPSRTSQLSTASAAVALLLAAAGCGGASNSSSNPPPSAQVVSIQLLPGKSSAPLGKSQQFKATATYSNGDTHDVTSLAAWNSSNPAVAAVNSSGLATSKSLGSALITASLDSIVGSASFDATPAVVTSVQVDPGQVSLPLGENQQFTATGTYSDGTRQDLTKTVVWKSSAPQVASVTSDGLATGTGLGQGSIGASLEGLAGAGVVTVTSAVLVSVDVFPDATSIPAGKTQQFTAVGNYSDGSNADLTHEVSWTSSDTDVAKINPSGLARGKSPGKDTITASTSEIAGSGALKVTPAVLVSLEVTPRKVSILFGKSQQFTATGTFSDGSKRDVTSSVDWSSTAPHVAMVSPTGLANSKDNGATAIGASQAGVQSSGDLHVLPVLAVNYFDNLNSGLKQDASVRLNHPGSPYADLCALIYVFDNDQQITECCGCGATPNGLRTFSVQNDLTGNPLTGKLSSAGTIKVVSADARTNPQCNAASFTPKGALRGWSTHIQVPDQSAVAITEGEFQEALLTADEQAKLEDQCKHIQDLGSGHGICSCGKGD